MALRKIFSVSRKTFLYPSGWLDLELLIAQNSYIASVLKPFFSKERPTTRETFEEAVARLNLTEADIQSAIKNYRLYAMILLIFGILVLGYSFFLLFAYGSFLSWMLGMACTALSFAQAFKFDFWSFQMRKRTLGLTFEAWKHDVLGVKGPSK